MKRNLLTKWLFIIAGVYEGFLGLTLMFRPLQTFARFDLAQPNHVGYVQFPAALLLIFAVMFFVIAWNPRRRKNLIPYGALLKIAYCGVVFGHWLAKGVPSIWKPFAIADVVFLVLFVWAFRMIRQPSQPAPSIFGLQ